MFKIFPLALAGGALALGLPLAPRAQADTPSGPQPKVDCGSLQNCWGTVDNVRWFSKPDGSEEVHYDASTLASDNIEGDAKRETVMVLNVAHNTFPNAPEVVVVVEGNMCDEYGNCSRSPAARWIYNQSTLAEINYDNVDPDNIWDLADGGSIIADNWTWHPSTARAFDRYLRARAKHPRAHEAALWLAERGGALTYIGLYKTLSRRADTGRIDGFHPHMLRHSFATRWLAAHGSEMGLMRAAGWARHEMMQRYTQASADDLTVAEAKALGLGKF